MRIIIRNLQIWGNYTTQGLDIDPNISILEFKSRVSNKFSIPINKILIKFTRDGFTIRITNEFDFKFYGISEKMILYVENIDLSIDEKNFEERRINLNYMGKLGLLASIKESVNDDETDHNKSKDFNTSLDGPKSITNSFDNSSDDESLWQENKKKQKQTTSFDVNKYIKYELENLLKATKLGEKRKIDDILFNLPKDQEDQITEEIKEDIFKKKKKLIDDLSDGGWGALHYAIFYSQIEIVKYYINERNADVNKETKDGCSPLQLAINKNNLDAFKFLLQAKNINLNFVNKKGSALHLAIKQDKIKFIKLLLKYNADVNLKDENEISCLESCENEDTKKFIENHVKFRRFSNDSNDSIPVITQIDKKLELDNNPPVIMGWLWKTGGLLFNVQERFVVVNPYEGTLIRYKRREHYPFKPIEILPLQAVKNVTFVERAWYMKNELHYFVIITHSKMIFACKHENAASEWINNIKKAKEYNQYIENQLKRDNSDLDTIANISFFEMQIKISTYEIKDEFKKKKLIQISSGGSNDYSPHSHSPSNKILDIPSPILSNASIETDPSSKVVQDTKKQKDNNDDNTFHITYKEENKSESNDSGQDENANTIIAKNLECLTPHVKFSSFDIIRLIGKGSFGQVFLVKKKDDGEIYAMKALKKRALIMKKQLRYAISEANVLKMTNHPFVLSLHFAFQTKEFLYFVMDYCNGGDLSYHLAQRVTFEEDEARFYIAELILAIQHLHSLNIIYRDLKPENILINTDGHIKLADFGLAKEGVEDNQTANSFCGSPAYLAPEVIKHKGSGKPADIYGIGTVLFEMLTGNPPYYDEHIPTLYKNIQEGNLIFPKNVSEPARDIIRKLLKKDPNTRIGVKNKKELNDHPFFEGVDWEKIAKKEYDPPFIEKDDENPESFVPLKKAIFRDTDYDEAQVKVNRLKNFSFARQNGVPLS